MQMIIYYFNYNPSFKQEFQAFLLNYPLFKHGFNQLKSLLREMLNVRHKGSTHPRTRLHFLHLLSLSYEGQMLLIDTYVTFIPTNKIIAHIKSCCHTYNSKILANIVFRTLNLTNKS